VWLSREQFVDAILVLSFELILLSNPWSFAYMSESLDILIELFIKFLTPLYLIGLMATTNLSFPYIYKLRIIFRYLIIMSSVTSTLYDIEKSLGLFAAWWFEILDSLSYYQVSQLFWVITKLVIAIHPWVLCLLNLLTQGKMYK